MPEVTVNGVKGKILKWTCIDNSTHKGRIITDSELDKYQKKRSISLGYSTKTVSPVLITNAKNIVNSITDAFAKDRLDVKDNSIYISKDSDMAVPGTYSIQSGVICFDSKVEIDSIDIFHDFLAEHGLLINSQSPTSRTPTTKIEEGKVYHITSESNDQASLKYDNVVYNSNSSTRMNSFRGVKDKTSFEPLAGSKPIVREVLDVACHQTLDIRFVDELPDENIDDTKQLLPNFWYIVSYDKSKDATIDQTGYITYNGTKYPCRSSFLATSDKLTFEIPVAMKGKVFLKRFCDKDHKPGIQNLDTNFWKNKQAPIPMPVVFDDLRAQFVGNSASSGIVKVDEAGIPFSSGHLDFYKMISSIRGIPMPAFNLSGKYLQLILKVSTQNGY